MDTNIQEKQKKRFKFLEAAYKEITGAGPAMFGVVDLGTKLGFSETESLEIAHYLYGEELLTPLGSHVAATTHKGVRAVEKALAAPEEPTQYFPPVNVIYVEHMSQSQIQQGTVNSTQTGSFSASDLQAISEFVQEFKSLLSEIPLSAPDRQEAEAEIATAEAQLRSSKPKAAILKACCEVLIGFLANLAGNTAAMHLQTIFPHFLK
jgi:hypothetical protein